MTTSHPKALFYNIPGHGHVNPSLPLVEELTRRGHEVVFFATPTFRDTITATGAIYRDTRGMPDDYFGSPNMNGANPMYAAHELWKTTEQILPDLIEEARAENADYVLFDQMCPWGFYIAGVLGVPSAASCSLLPLGVPTLGALQKPYIREIFLAVMRKGGTHGFKAFQVVRRLARKYGVPAPGFTQLLSLTGDVSLAYTIEEMPPFLEGLHPSIRFVGRTLPEDPPGDPTLFENLNGRPLVYVSLGSLINRNRDFYRMVIEAFTGADAFVMITTGRGVDPASLGPLPENIAVYEWLPQLAVLARASLFISHGGLNSIHDAFYYGVPLLVIPQQDEQSLNGWRAVDLGAGRMLRPDALTPTALHAEVTEMLARSDYKKAAVQLGERLRAAGGYPAAADQVEALLSPPTLPAL